MKLLHSAAELRSLPAAPIHWALGFFDGVHIGHRRVLESASSPGALRAVLSFAEHPLALLCPERQPLLLTPHAACKAALIEACGADVLLLLPFTRELAFLPPQDFLDWLAAACPAGIAGLSAGENWHFGRGGSGNADSLRAWGAKNGCRVCVQELLYDAGESVCSSRIRRLLQAGELAEATRLLGHPFCICGTVEQGQKLARQLGFPTANITLPPHAALPPFGVYEVACTHGGERLHGVANLGLRPTIDEAHKPVRLEVHFTNDWNGNLYGCGLAVELCRFIRPECRFDGLEALRAQMAADIASVENRA